MVLIVGAGSFIGGASRYLISTFVQQKSGSSFPYGTLAVNLVGCFIIGLLFGLAEKNNLSQEWRYFFITGIIGGFTTFSSFSLETINLFKNGQSLLAVLYISISLIIGLLLTIAGMLTFKGFSFK